MNSGVYEIVNTTNGKRYIGSAVNFAARWKGHRLDLRKGVHHSRALQRAFTKYGADAFVFRRLLVCLPANLIMYEQIAFDSMQPEYNTSKTAGSNLGVTLTAETRAKMSAARRGKPGNMRWRRHTPETRAKMSAAHIGNTSSAGRTDRRGVPMSAEARAINSAAQKGKVISPEHRAKISASLAGRSRMSPEGRARVSAAMTGRIVSAKTRARASASKMGNTYTKGQTRSPEARARMVAAWEKRRTKAERQTAA